MFLWWAGPPKVGKWPFLGFHKLKNRLFEPYFGVFMAKKWGKMFIFMFKTTHEHLWDVYRLYLGIFEIFVFFDPLEGHFWAKIGQF